MDLDFIIEELRKLEHINTSFNYGVELLVMGIKADAQYIKNVDDLKYVVACGFRHWGTLFKFDEVCRNGFEVANNKLMEIVNE